MKLTSAAQLCACLAFTACTEGMEQSSHLGSEPRLLAIGADNPSPFVGETVIFSTLIHNPNHEPNSFQWSWCPQLSFLGFGEDSCPDTAGSFAEELSQAGATNTTFPFMLGDAVSAKLTFNPGPFDSDKLCNTSFFGGSSDGPQRHCPGGIPATVTLKLSKSIELVANQSVTFLEVAGNSEYPATALQNRNPNIALISFGKSQDTLSPLPVTAGSATARIGQAYHFYASVPTSEAQQFGMGEDPKPDQTVTEYLSISWYTTVGHFKFSSTSSTAATESLSRLAGNIWIIPKDETPKEARLIFVLRDDRGGVSWQERRIQVQP